MSSAPTKTKRRGYVGMNFPNPIGTSERSIKLQKRLDAATQASLNDPTCLRLRSWLLKTEPGMMPIHESDTLVGAGMVALGMDPDEMHSQPEQLRVLCYQNAQRKIAAELGHCLTGCDDDHRVNGICKHTGQACSRDELAETIELMGLINRPLPLEK